MKRPLRVKYLMNDFSPAEEEESNGINESSAGVSFLSNYGWLQIHLRLT